LKAPGSAASKEIAMGDIATPIPAINNYADPGPIPDFLDRSRRAPPPDLGGTMQPNNPTEAAPSSVNLGGIVQPNDLIKIGRQAWARLQTHETWNDWTKTGAALLELRTKAMQSAKTNQPKGSRYNKEFSARLRVHGFDLEKSTRARLLQCMENICAIEDWRSKLEPDKQLKLNHPTIVLNAWKRAIAEPKSTTEKPKVEKPTSNDWNLFFEQFTLEDFLAAMPSSWREELLTRRDNLDKSKTDPKVAATIKAALLHTAIANDPKSDKTTTKNHEIAALGDLRSALSVLAGLDRTPHDVEIRLIKTQKPTA
jgi:hypothetical protein